MGGIIEGLEVTAPSQFKLISFLELGVDAIKGTKPDNAKKEPFLLRV